MMNNAPFSDLRGEHRAEPVPPKTHRLLADIDTALEQQVFDLTERQRIADIAQCSGLPPASSGNHRSDGSQAGHALTFKLDHSMGADHFRLLQVQRGCATLDSVETVQRVW